MQRNFVLPCCEKITLLVFIPLKHDCCFDTSVVETVLKPCRATGNYKPKYNTILHQQYPGLFSLYFVAFSFYRYTNLSTSTKCKIIFVIFLHFFMSLCGVSPHLFYVQIENVLSNMWIERFFILKMYKTKL